MLLCTTATAAWAQRTVVEGVVTDAETGEPLPFANVYFKGTSIGANTEADGTFYISTQQQLINDTLVVAFVGYIPQSIPIQTGTTQSIEVSLIPDVVNLDEIVFIEPENPAWAILRQVIKNKKKNNPDNFNTIVTENYTRIEFDLAQLSESMQSRKLYGKVEKALDTIQTFKEDGEPYIPIFFSESISKSYSKGKLFREEIEKANIEGVGVTNKKSVAQLTGVSFQQYNFYDNQMNIINKNFTSPIADGWRIYYDYYLEDSTMIDGRFCYRIDFEPKASGDLSFYGTMWIDKETYALKSIDVEVRKQANLNFVERMAIEQDLMPTPAGPWLPKRTDFEIEIEQLTGNTSGARAAFLIITQDYEVNVDLPDSFFLLALEVSDDVTNTTSEFWDDTRPEPLGEEELNAREAIATIQGIRQVWLIAEIVKTVRRGYIRTGKIDWGPYLWMYSNNALEGSRFQLGFRTNDEWSEKVVFSGYGAYGTLDERWKYGGTFRYIASKKPWTLFELEHRNDLEQIGVLVEGDRDNFIFFAASNWGSLFQPYYQNYYRFTAQTDPRQGFTQTVDFEYETFDPAFPFAYQQGFDENSQQPIYRSTFTTSEVTFTSRFTRQERFIFDNNRRVGVTTGRAPIFTVRYQLGLKNLFGSDFGYHKFTGKVEQEIPLGFLGKANYVVEGGYIPSVLPYPLLRNHVGNSTIFFNIDAFNLMLPGEFVSDKYAFVKYNHNFEGFILNRIPLMKKLKWRLVAGATVLYGHLSDKNKALIPATDLEGEEIRQPESTERGPYAEIGYGLDNIGRFFRVSLFHRITYRNNPGAQNFGVRLLFTVRP